jgi:hypothetical protein
MRVAKASKSKGVRHALNGTNSAQPKAQYQTPFLLF